MDQPAFLLNIACLLPAMFNRKAADTPKVGTSRVLVKASPAFGRRCLLKKTRTFLFLPRVVLEFGKFNCRSLREEEGVGAKFDLFSEEGR